jgi:hypothetical protein
VVYSKKIIPSLLLILSVFGFVFAQDNKKGDKNKDKNLPPQALTAEQTAEAVILFYGSRENLTQIRKTSIERGKITKNSSDGNTETINYEKRTLRGDELSKDKIRLDLESPSARYSLLYNDNKVFGIFNETVFAPKPEDTKYFQNQMYHGIDTFLRYKENGSKLGKEKKLGVEYYKLAITDKDNRKTTFFISVRLFRIAWFEYEENSIKYAMKFFDFRYAQNTLFAYRQTLFANDKQIEETNISTISFGQKIDESLFQAG